ncbi:MAG: ABC transporter permease [Bacteroidales bacterium]|jgi:ABC-type antimicrobial peptide transport system permease subunit|nr:ABC transporter permease [Bacteroidales bacterium]
MNIKQSFRIIFRNKTYSILNIAGLAIGIAAAALILLWVEYQFNFDKALPKSDLIYQIAQNQRYGDKIYTFFVAPGPLSETLNESFPEIKRNTRYSSDSEAFFTEAGRNSSVSMQGVYADSTVFSMLSMTFVEGDPRYTFARDNSIVISRKMAEIFFKDDVAVGKMLETETGKYYIDGVFENIPKNTTFRFDWIIPFRLLEQMYEEKGWANVKSWTSNWMNCFVELEPYTNVEVLNDKLAKLISEKTNETASHFTFFIYPQRDFHLYGEFQDGKPTGSGYIRTVRLFFWIGALILLIACVNYMNLATARSEKRALEVGVRKTFGARRSGLVWQFLREASMITIAALLLAIALIYIFLPAFNRLIFANLAFDFTNPYHVLGLLCVGVLCAFLAGNYPAFYLSSYLPINTLKKLKKKGGAAAWIRKGLVVFQFAVSFILICATFVIYLQIGHAQNRPLGFIKENTMIFPITEEMKMHSETVRNELLNTGLIKHAGFTSHNVIQIYSNGGGYQWPDKRDDFNPLISMMFVGPGFIEAAGFTLLEGASFSRIDDADEDGMGKIVINRRLAEIMGESGRVGGFMGQGSDGEYYWEIIGIIDDFVFNNMYAEESEPLILFAYPNHANYIIASYEAGDSPAEVQAKVRNVLQTFSPDYSSDALFMDEIFNNMFYSERLIGSLATLFAVLAIVISCLGLFGLSAFSAEQRTKEIGIRKVLGASVSQIVFLLGKSFMLLTLIAFAIAIPVAWFVSDNWLKSYAYKIDLNWAIFAGTALLIILIVIITTSVQSIRAATADPVKSIKTE